MKVEKIPDDGRPIRELDDEVEKEIKNIFFEKGMWQIGGRYNHPYWRVILTMTSLPYDIALPGLFKTEQEVIKQASRIVSTLTQ